jgi:hypothetical protein
VARDVEVNVTANDKTGNGLAAAERAFRETAKRTETESDRMGNGLVGKVTQFAPKLTGVLTSAVGTAGQAGGPLLAGGLATAAPVIASTIAGGIIGGVGLGGVVGGLVVASKDARVAGAIKGLGDGLQDRLEGAAGAFIGPAIEGVGIIDKALDSIDVEGIFAKSSAFVVPLAEGVGRAVEGLGNGIEDLVDNAGPAIDSIATGIGDVGEAIGDGLSSLADNGESAAESLDLVFDTIVLVTDAVFGLINGAMEAKEAVDDFAGGVLAFDSGLKLLNLTFGENDEIADATADTYELVEDAVRSGEGALTDFQKAMRDVSDEMLAQTDPLFGLLDAQNQVTDAQKDYNDALKKHGPRSQEAKDALANLGEAAFRMNGKVADAAGGFDGRLTPAMRTALRNARLSETQIDKLERELRAAASAAKAWEGTFQQTYLVTRKENVSYGGNSVTGARADGGPVDAGESYLVGERGPEILQMGNRSGTVIPNHALSGLGGGDLYLTLDLGEGITQRLRVDRRDLKRRAMAGVR